VGRRGGGDLCDNKQKTYTEGGINQTPSRDKRTKQGKRNTKGPKRKSSQTALKKRVVVLGKNR